MIFRRQDVIIVRREWNAGFGRIKFHEGKGGSWFAGHCRILEKVELFEEYATSRGNRPMAVTCRSVEVASDNKRSPTQNFECEDVASDNKRSPTSTRRNSPKATKGHKVRFAFSD